MIEKIHDPISVGFVFKHQSKSLIPKWIVWQSRIYPITKIGLHHSFYRGKILYHVFSVSNDLLFFRLLFDTTSLLWFLEEVADGN